LSREAASSAGAHLFNNCGCGISPGATVGSPVLYAGKRLLLTTIDGTFEVTSLKPDGKNAMNAAAFAAGTKQLQKNSDEPATWQAVNGDTQ
jgi:methionyl-tRNA formyltransferase